MEVTPLVCFVLVLVVSYGIGFPVSEWQEWKAKYNKHYTTPEEESQRQSIWLKHYEVFQQHMNNENREFDMEMNEYSDQILPRNNINMQNQFGNVLETPLTVDSLIFAPSSWDWRTKGAITPVRNQGQLGDALSFAATECVESFHCINEGKLVLLSTGEMHDCCTSQPVLSKDIFTCVHNIGGLCSRADYPAPSNICRNKTCTAAAQVKGGMQSPSGDEEKLMENVYMMPVLVGVDASHASFQLYRGGVYSDPACSKEKLDHAMQLIGYGTTTGGQDYWICKNSWGASWGEAGYIRIARNKDNMCGIATSAFYPV